MISCDLSASLHWLCLDCCLWCEEAGYSSLSTIARSANKDHDFGRRMLGVRAHDHDLTSRSCGTGWMPETEQVKHTDVHLKSIPREKSPHFRNLDLDSPRSHPGPRLRTLGHLCRCALCAYTLDQAPSPFLGGSAIDHDGRRDHWQASSARGPSRQSVWSRPEGQRGLLEYITRAQPILSHSVPSRKGQHCICTHQETTPLQGHLQPGRAPFSSDFLLIRLSLFSSFDTILLLSCLYFTAQKILLYPFLILFGKGGRVHLPEIQVPLYSK